MVIGIFNKYVCILYEIGDNMRECNICGKNFVPKYKVSRQIYCNECVGYRKSPHKKKNHPATGRKKIVGLYV